jgi:hypothetical protein
MYLNNEHVTGMSYNIVQCPSIFYNELFGRCYKWYDAAVTKVFAFLFYLNLTKKEHLNNAKLDNIFTFPILEYALTPCFPRLKLHK